jgi:hypothetical protein
VSHAHLLLDDVSCDEQEQCGDKFFLVIKDNVFPVGEDILFSPLNQALEVTHYYME